MNETAIPKMHPKLWAHIAHRLGQRMPKAWSPDAHVLVLEEPQIAHRLTAWRSAADLLAGMMKGGVIEYRTLYVREVNRLGKMLEVSIYIDEAEE